MKKEITTRRGFLAASAAGCLAGGAMPAVVRGAEKEEAGPIELPIRTRQLQKNAGVAKIEPKKTAVLICDMWDKHWCKSAVRRCGALAYKMAPLIEEARDAGLLIVHAPSDTMEFYRDHPARKRALAVATVAPPVPIEKWCPLEKAKEGDLPIDDSDNGCDCQPQCPTGSPWTRQQAVIKIADADFISDDGRQVYSYFAANDIDHVIYVGVHTNMCVLGRSFGIRQMSRLGLKPILVRDLTDTMYNPRMKPFVPHDKGTDLVIAHIERHWCPTTDSAALALGLRR